jgi:CubicO group peptidase (beta-lactamase class C family)
MRRSEQEQTLQGLRTVVVRNGAIVAEQGGGTLVPWWSVTKTVIAAAALVLVNEGRLHLDRLLPGQPFTLRQLLQHRAGLCDYGELPEYHAAVVRGDAPWSPDDMLLRSDAARLRYPPGEGWGYSNIGYFLAVRAMEAASGQSLESVLQSRVLHPLEIDQVRVAREVADMAGAAMGKAEGYDPGRVYHGLLVGPLRQAPLLLDRLLTGGLLPAALRDELLTGHPVEGDQGERPWSRPAYGLGVMMDRGRPDHPVGHTGGGPGSAIAVYRTEANGTGTSIAAFGLEASAADVERYAMAARDPRAGGGLH